MEVIIRGEVLLTKTRNKRQSKLKGVRESVLTEKNMELIIRGEMLLNKTRCQRQIKKSGRESVLTTVVWEWLTPVLEGLFKVQFAGAEDFLWCQRSGNLGSTEYVDQIAKEPLELCVASCRNATEKHVNMLNNTKNRIKKTLFKKIFCYVQAKYLRTLLLKVGPTVYAVRLPSLGARQSSISKRSREHLQFVVLSNKD